MIRGAVIVALIALLAVGTLCATRPWSPGRRSPSGRIGFMDTFERVSSTCERVWQDPGTRFVNCKLRTASAESPQCEARVRLTVSLGNVREVVEIELMTTRCPDATTRNLAIEFVHPFVEPQLRERAARQYSHPPTAVRDQPADEVISVGVNLGCSRMYSSWYPPDAWRAGLPNRSVRMFASDCSSSSEPEIKIEPLPALPP
jgi:hypothetical protein